MNNKNLRHMHGKDYNWLFDDKTGFFARWGKTSDDDPEYSPIGPEIADIEISTICHGPNGVPCKACYKSNTGSGINMSYETFVDVFDKISVTGNLLQIAFGVGDIDGNPDLFKMMAYCRQNKVVPNITINGSRMTSALYTTLATLCGAVAVSHYDDDSCFKAVQLLGEAGLKQVNIHQILSKESLDDGTCMNLLKAKQNDIRLKNLNAIVFLTLKPVGNRNDFTVPAPNDPKYLELIEYALANNIAIGFDSCGAYRFLNAVKDRKEYNTLATASEPCESTLFSIYINAEGISYPCSFAEQINHEGIDLKVINKENFIKDVWFSNIYTNFRTKLNLTKNNIHNCRRCPLFGLD